MTEARLDQDDELAVPGALRLRWLGLRDGKPNVLQAQAVGHAACRVFQEGETMTMWLATMIDRAVRYALDYMRACLAEWDALEAAPPKPRPVPPRASITVHGPHGVETLHGSWLYESVAGSPEDQ